MSRTPEERLFPESRTPTAEMTVGPDGGDLRGQDHRVIQAAIEYLATLGGGTVRLLPGVYECGDRVKLRSRVNLVGGGPGVVLRKSPGFEMPLLTDGDYGESQVSVLDAGRWQPGMGLTVSDDSTVGWHETTATVTAVEESTLHLDRPLLGDNVLVARRACVRHIFPVISLEGCERVTLADFTVEGNKIANAPLNGCIGGGVHVYRSQSVKLENLHVCDFNGDGLSFQTSNEVIVERCTVTGCSGIGIHPGSGSQRARVVGCQIAQNGGVGLFVCWRVRHGVFADNTIERNRSHGISVGHKDTENLFEGNRVSENGGHGLLFRDEPEHLAAHRCVVRRNVLEDNGRMIGDGCGIRVEGTTIGLAVERNRIVCNPGGRQRVGIWLGAETDRINLVDNQFDGHAGGDVQRGGTSANADVPPKE